ncbi:hypothetical protein EDD22DRAFT_851665 [Suillus occidentalis]|nr:hypothetical protein EDD22DRAFT_851665 [Suillus occidentalis]
MPRYPRTTEPKPSKPRTKRVPAMSVRPLVPVETRPSQIQAESSSSGGTGWSENAWEETPTIATKPPRGPKIVEYCNKPGQFWPDGQEPPFKGQKHRRRVFVTKGKRQPREEITNNVKEINRLKEDVRPTQSFTPRTGDILVYHDYSDYEGSDEDDFFESLDDDEESTHTPLAPLPPPTRTLTPDPPTTAPIPDEASLPSLMVAPPPPLPPFTTTAAPPPPISTPSHSLPAGLTAGVDDIKERRQEMIRKYKAKADARAAEAARLKKEKDALEQHIEVNAKEDERSKAEAVGEAGGDGDTEGDGEKEGEGETEGDGDGEKEGDGEAGGTAEAEGT